MAIVAVEIAIVVTAFTKKGEVEHFLDKRMQETLNTAKTNKGFFATWDLVQREMKCCGVNGSSDWTQILGHIHPACCDKKIDDPNGCAESRYKKGCKDAFKEFVSNNLLQVIGVAVGVGVFQLLGIVFSCCLYSAYRRSYHY